MMGDEEVERRAEGVEIGGRGGVPALADLGREVGRGAAHGGLLEATPKSSSFTTSRGSPASAAKRFDGFTSR